MAHSAFFMRSEFTLGETRGHRSLGPPCPVTLGLAFFVGDVRSPGAL